MTNEQRVEAYKMLLDGATYREVGEKFGLTHQRIHQIFSGQISKVKKYACIYPNIRRWIVENHITQPVFAEMVGVCPAAIHHYLSGKREPNKKTIDKILEVTGMTYEEAFKR
jgi:predicted transcriptional regulator